MEVIFVIFSVLVCGFCATKGDEWPWTKREGTTNLFRRLESSLVKTAAECQCPPNKECVIEFKLNPAMMEFLNIQGLLTKDEVKEINEELTQNNIPVFDADSEKAAAIRSRRKANEDESSCCCPPRSVMMPTFITDRKFKVLSNRFPEIFNNTF
ncbi:uncharacterized protein LOC142986376 isoform X2 [Anticarsia gemmatalis]|uniref:uncharacterized protein LOC142986376 isoform X2 n=1 Tax=Anticarsia gemmatalis TaxID=129554 RepID=UPI003F76A7F4